jgi:signal transduction histidine kinase
MSGAWRLGAAFLQEKDLGRFNYWLWLTRLRCIAGVLLLTLAVRWTGPSSAVRMTPILTICAIDLIFSVVYRRWLRTRRYLRLLAYVQLAVDTLAILSGLLFVGTSRLMFHFLPLLAVVPASMMELQCGLCISVLATAGHFVILALTGDAAWLSVDGILPPATFFLITGQSLFYVEHLAQKNAALAAAADSVNESNRRLEEEAAISAALLGVAQTLTTSLEAQDILARLNESVRGALHCDFSITLLREAARDIYRVAAVSGSEPEILDEVQSFEFPTDSAPIFGAVATQGLVTVEDRTSALFPAHLMERWHITSFMLVDLQRAGVSIGLLAAGFNERAGPFSHRELRLFGSIAQQAAVALENARLVDSLRAASRLKTEFIGTMSHELRSPLNVVIGYVDLLLSGDMGGLAGEQHQALERVQQHALQLLELIQETLDVNRLEAGLLPLDIETFVVREFLAEVKDSIATDWLKPDVALRWQIDGAPSLIRSDRAKLKKVLRNLIHNALKFTDRGAVTVQVGAENGWIEFAISDTGIGINSEALPVIFEMFRQGDSSSTRRHGGVGLGLYIVRQLVRALGGDITVSSTIAEGSTFQVRLRRGGEITGASGAPQSAVRSA